MRTQKPPRATPPLPPPPRSDPAAAPGVGRAVPPALSAALLEPARWRESLEAYAASTHLAVALVDAAGRLLGPCVNPRPTWRRVQAAQGTTDAGCPFTVASPTPCTCVGDALARRALVLARDRTGLVHVAVPLLLDDQPLGALLAGQVFDQYPEPLVLEQIARRVGLPPQALWQVARREVPVTQATLEGYGRLLAVLGQAFLQTRAHTLREAQHRATLEQHIQARTAALHHELAARTAAEAQVRQAHAHLRALMARLEALQEAERTRLARDLHDDFSQQLTGLAMNLAWLAQQLGTMTRSRRVPVLLARVVDSLALVQHLTTSMHDLATDLRPSVLDRLGLGPALVEEARRFQARTAIGTTVHLPDPELALAPDLATTLFRLCQECLTNVARHAGATQVEVALTAADDWVTLRVQDNGRGMPETAMDQPAGLGVLGMRERATLMGGEVCWTRGAGPGTVVTVRLPQHSPPARESWDQPLPPDLRR